MVLFGTQIYTTPHRLLITICVTWLLIVAATMAMTRDRWVRVEERDVELEGVVHNIIDQRGLRQTVRVETLMFRHRVQLTVGGYPPLHVGDRIRVPCTLQDIRSIVLETFRYDRYLMKERVAALCTSWSTPTILGRDRGAYVWLVERRTRMERALQRVLHEPHASFLIGLLYGASSTLPESWQEAFRRSGTMHIVAVSGYNVMLVSSAIMYTLTAMAFRRQHAFGFVLVGIVLFVVIAGGDPAVIRAGVMGALVLTAQQIGRPSCALSLLCIAATVMTMFNPRLLLDDAGFQLSFSAAMGLIWLSPWIQTHLQFLPRTIARTFSETLSAIIATTPIMLFDLHQWSFAAPIANLFIVPLVPPAMLAGIVAVLGASIASWLDAPTLGVVLAMPVYVILDVMLELIRHFASLPFMADV